LPEEKLVARFGNGFRFCQAVDRLQLIDHRIVDKARRRTPGTKINVKATLNFPNGERPRVVIPDVEFGELPLNFGSRSDYGAVTLDFEASEAQVIT
jgi:hypothetical protein